MSWYLFLDDDARTPGMAAFRYPPKNEKGWKVACSSIEAMNLIEEFGIPAMIDFDHDYGNNDDAMKFLRMFRDKYPEAVKEIQGYRIHSANPNGAENIHSFMESWKKVVSS